MIQDFVTYQGYQVTNWYDENHTLECESLSCTPKRWSTSNVWSLLCCALRLNLYVVKTLKMA